MSRRGERNPAELSQERRLLLQRYLDEWLEGAGKTTTAVEPGLESEHPALHLAVAPEPGIAVEEERPRRRRGRPPGAPSRRQVHFHVNPDEDQILLRAAGRFGSQQKALIAALYALNEVLALRDQVELLQSENSRQRRLLSDAQEFFRSS